MILCPESTSTPEILYIEGDPEAIQKKTGIEQVYPPENLTADLSNAYSDFALLRYTQRRFKPLQPSLRCMNS